MRAAWWWLAAAVSVSTWTPARGSTPDTLRISLDETVSRALEASAEIDQAEALAKAADAAASGARAQRFPRIDLSGSYSRLSSVPAFSIGVPGAGTLEVFPDIQDSWRSRLQVSVPLFTGGALGGQIAAARSHGLAATGEADAVRSGLVLQATSTYWNLVRAERNEAAVAQALEAYEGHLKDARNRREAGLAAESEVLAVEVQRDRVELAHLRARSAVEVAQADLRRLLDLPPETPVAAVDVSDEPPPLPEEGLETLYDEARRRRPDRYAIAAEVEAAAARIRVARSAWWPQLSAAAGFDYSNPNPRYFPQSREWNDSWDASVAASLHVFDFGRTRAAVAGAKAGRNAAQSRLESFDRSLRLDVTRRFLDLKTARDAVTVAERAVESARESRKVALDRYQQGVGSSSDLLDAEAAELQSALDRIDALASASVARAALEQALGRTP